MSFAMLTEENYLLPSWTRKREILEGDIDRFFPMLTESVVGSQSSCEPVVTLEALRFEMNSCNTCGVSWIDQHVSLDCAECGGYALTKPCPRCNGKCRTQWRRNLAKSHSTGKAHWDGECHVLAKTCASVSNILSSNTNDALNKVAAS